MGAERSRLRVGVDTGGTFIDFVVHDTAAGTVRIHKLPSGKDTESAAVIGEGLGSLGAPGDFAEFVHGTTIGLNALLVGRGSPTGLLITEGFRGVYEVGDQSRPHGSGTYDIFYARPAPLVLPRHTEEVRERISAGGDVILPLDEEGVERSLRRLYELGIRTIAVALLSSYRNPVHERRIGAIAATLYPDLNVTLSSGIANHLREYQRTSTAVVNAALNPLVAEYLLLLDRSLEPTAVPSSRRFVMHSDGGMGSFQLTSRESVRTVFSGPAAGVTAALQVGSSVGRDNLVTFDMGGTSTDVALIVGGRPLRRTQSKVAGRDLSVPLLDIHSIAAGGGTIARAGRVGNLEVGPASAAAVPGPACYGRGGEDFTVTDADLMLGFLAPLQALGGQLVIEPELAERAAERLARILQLTSLETAWGVFEIINVKMAEAIRAVSSSRGYDLADFGLVAFGGAGPVHAGWLAAELGIREVVVPSHPGVHSAVGLLVADVTHESIRTLLMILDERSSDRLGQEVVLLADSLVHRLLEEGFELSRISLRLLLDLRYEGQGYELELHVGDFPIDVDEHDLPPDAFGGLRERFDDLHAAVTGHAAPDRRVEVVNLRVIGIGKVLPMVRVERSGRRSSKALLGTQEMVIRGERHEARIIDRHLLGRSERVDGPAILVQLDCTTVIYPGQCAEVCTGGELLIHCGS